MGIYEEQRLGIGGVYLDDSISRRIFVLKACRHDVVGFHISVHWQSDQRCSMNSYSTVMASVFALDDNTHN